MSTVAVERLARDRPFHIGDSNLVAPDGEERLEGRFTGVASIDEKWVEVAVVTDRDPPVAEQGPG